MSRSGFYVRPPNEYAGPTVRLDLESEFPDDEEWIEIFGRGTYHHANELAAIADRGTVEVELVPEPGNPWDRTAVALDVRAVRVGYLSSFMANSWHDVLILANEVGYSVRVRGELRPYVDAGERHIGLDLRLPKFDALVIVGEKFGLKSSCEALLDELDAHTSEILLETVWDEVPKWVIRDVLEHSAKSPALTWTDRKGKPRKDLPGFFVQVVRNRILKERRGRQLQREKERNATRAAKLAEREARAAVSEQLAKERAESAARLSAEVLRLMDLGMPQTHIATRLDVGLSRVSAIVKDLRGTPSSFHADQRSKRFEKAQRALSLQRSGLARAKIATVMKIGPDSVKELLRDAKFYEAPHLNPERLNVAKQCANLRRDGRSKAQIASFLGLASPKVVQAFRDADAIGIA